MTIQCCVCKKVRVEEEWSHRKPERAEMVSHTYCPECLPVFIPSKPREVMHGINAQVVAG